MRQRKCLFNMALQNTMQQSIDVTKMAVLDKMGHYKKKG
jgi:hypothetical protein